MGSVYFGQESRAWTSFLFRVIVRDKTSSSRERREEERERRKREGEEREREREREREERLRERERPGRAVWVVEGGRLGRAPWQESHQPAYPSFSFGT
jgi:hypothetical protein